MAKLFEVSSGMLPAVAEIYERTEKSLNEDVETLKNWIKTQPHLPEIMNDKSIQNILLLCKCSVEKAKKRIDMYYTLRSRIPDFYTNINPKCAEVKTSMEICYWLTLPKLTKEMYRVWISKMRVNNRIDDMNPLDVFKITLNTYEIRLNEDVVFGDIVVSDLKGLPFSYMLKLTPAFMSKFLTIYDKIYSLPLKGLYLINCPSYIDTVLSMLKMVLKPKIFQRVRTCKDESILHEYFPKEMLPKDYGGEEMSMEELLELQKQKFYQYETRFDVLDRLKVDENLRPVKLDNDDVLGYYGNFKKLDVD